MSDYFPKSRNQERFLWILALMIFFDAAVFSQLGWSSVLIVILELLFITLAAERCDIEGIIPALRNAIDFGNWTSGEGESCARHGKQYGGLTLHVSPRPGEFIIRRYCGLCLLDALDRAVPSMDAAP